MPTLSRLLTGYSKRSVRRIGVYSVVLLSLVTALATWRGSPFAVLLPVGLGVLALVLFTVARRAMRAASTTIEKILREELNVDGVHVDNDVYTEDDAKQER
jgi:hypothetical protein